MTDQDEARAGRFMRGIDADRQIAELTGLARGLIADGNLNDAEIHFLHKWMIASDHAKTHPLLKRLVVRVNEILADGVIDEDERQDLQSTISALTASDFELGEVAKSSTLPLCAPAPAITYPTMRFCFTGTFTFGKRDACEAEAVGRGASIGSLTQRTNFLVIGDYATAAWKQSSFGRKIEQAVEWRDAGLPIAIVSEGHWRRSLA